MPLKNYGVLKGTVIGHLRNADDDHYQILIKAGNTLYRIAVNVKSAAENAPSDLLYATSTTLPAELKTGLSALNAGYKKLASKAGGLAQDYVRGGLVNPANMKPVPPESEGPDNDLKDKLEDAIIKALAEPGSMLYAFGEKWGPENNKADKYFKFKPGNGIHDIHMNQGNSGKWKKDNGAFQDGALFIQYPGDKWRAFFLAFQSQTFKTDNNGNPLGATPPAKKKSAKKAVKSRKG
ncbi:MAG TPA: YukJ family protein [Blastocatellia bacterium]|nr:YukJ family protein [Blastocatellia bacterium]HMV82615.1 YukJ family protein [Blastocatellia bacterium]HMY71988.1 YukJ family protein [Blastocatellia bacterium]HNG32955.1 YukJ family protein [Blastocatellia bacterium]